MSCSNSNRLIPMTLDVFFNHENKNKFKCGNEAIPALYVYMRLHQGTVPLKTYSYTIAPGVVFIFSNASLKQLISCNVTIAAS